MYITTSSIKNEDSSPEYLLYLEHNKIRQNPSSYIPILKEVLKMYRTKNILHFYNEHPFKTYEGRNLIYETIKFLENKKPTPPLIYSQTLSISSHNHAVDLGTHNLNSHEGSNKSTLRERVEKFSEWNGLLCESIEFGVKNPEYIMCKLIMCDGNKDRFQRQNVFNENLKYIGIGINNHIHYGNVIVINYAMEIRKAGSALDDEDFIEEYLNTSFYFNYMKRNNYIVNSIKKDSLYDDDSNSSSFNLSIVSDDHDDKKNEKNKKKNNKETRNKFKRAHTRKKTVQAFGDEKKLIYNIDNNIIEQIELSEEDESSSEVAHKEQDKKPIINDGIKESINSNNSSNESFEINNYVDFDVPENTINKEYKLIIKNYNGVKIHVIQKIYTLKDGKIHIIECEYKPNKLNKI